LSGGGSASPARANAKEHPEESVLETCLREGREIGLGIIIADQCISAVSPTALANCFTTVCMNVRQRADVNAAAGSLLISEDKRQLLSTLPVGEAVVRLSDRFPHPMHIRVPRLDLPKGAIQDRDVRDGYLAGPYCASALDTKVDGAPTHSTLSGQSTDSRARERQREVISARPLTDKTIKRTDSTHASEAQANNTTPPTTTP
jgi:hypothetical protein